MIPPELPYGTRPTVMDKDRLAAFVDGELGPEAAASVVMHLADHPMDQAYVDDLVAANVALMQAFGAPMDEPVPEDLRNFILPSVPDASVVPFRAKARPPALVWGGLGIGVALAAGLAVAVFLPVVDPLDLRPGPLPAASALHAALTDQPAGEVRSTQDGAQIMILGSVPTPEGYCREIEVVRAASGKFQAALACTQGVGWTVEVVIAELLESAGAAEGFGTASGDEAQGFAPFLDRIGAGAFLGPDDEAAAIAKGWNR